MDPAVALAQAYLQLNGYLTVTEFPITTGASPSHWPAMSMGDLPLRRRQLPQSQGSRSGLG